ncbi:hypothetical protein ENBRE01_1951 [Enteropsectra breve]|nr:hypothetical protein ENBRE01_1951 [Enteropsectra breve]
MNKKHNSTTNGKYKKDFDSFIKQILDAESSNTDDSIEMSGDVEMEYDSEDELQSSVESESFDCSSSEEEFSVSELKPGDKFYIKDGKICLGEESTFFCCDNQTNDKHNDKENTTNINNGNNMNNTHISNDENKIFQGLSDLRVAKDRRTAGGKIKTAKTSTKQTKKCINYDD